MPNLSTLREAATAAFDGMGKAAIARDAELREAADRFAEAMRKAAQRPPPVVPPVAPPALDATQARQEAANAD